MKYSFFNFVAASKFFFGGSYILVSPLVKVCNHIVKNRTIYCSLQHQDNIFISQFMFAIDSKVSLWLDSCKEKQFRDDNYNESVLEISPTSSPHLFERLPLLTTKC